MGSGFFPLGGSHVHSGTYYGAGEWNRTTDLRFTKPLLCQLSYAGFPEATHFPRSEARSYSGRETPVNAGCDF